MKLSFLQALLALGPKLPQILDLIHQGYQIVVQVITLLGLSPADVAEAIKQPAPATRDKEDPNAIAEAEQKLDEEISQHLRKHRDASGMLGGGFLNNLRQLYQFLESSGLLGIIMSLLTKAKGKLGILLFAITLSIFPPCLGEASACHPGKRVVHGLRHVGKVVLPPYRHHRSCR